MAAEPVFEGITKECDVVMKGGITSGVIYPRLISTLAKTYKLRSFGGTSAGAIAAAAGAAAQLGRLTGSNLASFDTLSELPTDLGAVPQGATDSMLFRLFQAQPPLAGLFSVLKAALNATSGIQRSWAIAGALLAHFPFAAVIGAAPGVLIWWYSSSVGTLLAILFALVGALVGAIVGAALCMGRELPQNDFGLCNGMSGVVGGSPIQDPLTPWLHRYLNGLAGKSGPDPLTFGELWAGKLRAAGEEWNTPDSSAPRAVDLAMITTGLNLGRPYRLPFESTEIYFTEKELIKLFPTDVVSWLVTHSRPSETASNLSRGGVRYHALPIASDTPVIMAVRLSLSFPILLSAVPFYVVDRTLTANAAQATVATRVYFSDGGICSNFPIQFFDSALPTRPTFGVDLRPFHPDHPTQRVWMPGTRENSEGVQIYCPPISTVPGFGSVVSFAGTILTTMQNWQDQMQLVMPGFRDRIVHVSHTEQEGGINLNMPAATIAAMADSGVEAASGLIEGFANGGGLAAPNAWDNHQRIRVRTLLCLIQQQLESISKGLDNQQSPTWTAIVGDANPPSYPFNAAELANAANQLLLELEQLARRFPQTAVPLCVGAPRPSPELKVAPRI